MERDAQTGHLLWQGSAVAIAVCRGGAGKTVVLGMRQRNGIIVTRVVADRKSGNLHPKVLKFVKPYTEVHTDMARLWRARHH